jgi:hypothetical protein
MSMVFFLLLGTRYLMPLLLLLLRVELDDQLLGSGTSICARSGSWCTRMR